MRHSITQQTHDIIRVLSDRVDFLAGSVGSKFYRAGIFGADYLKDVDIGNKPYVQCFLYKSETKSISTTSEFPWTSMYFHIYKKIYYATACQHILILLVSFES